MRWRKNGPRLLIEICQERLGSRGEPLSDFVQADIGRLEAGSINGLANIRYIEA